MTKQKTRKELEKKYKEANEDRVFFIITIIVLMLCGFYYSSKSDKLETQLSECQEQVPGLSNLYIKNNSKGEYSISVWSKNGTLIPSEDIILQKLNHLISFSHSKEWKYYVYTFEEKYYIDGEQVLINKCDKYNNMVFNYTLSQEEIKGVILCWKEQVPVWTLRVECYQTNLSYRAWNIFQTNVIWDRVLFEDNFTSYKDYQERLDWFEDYDRKWFEVRDCEVIE